MTSVRFVFPKPKLAALLKAPGGMTAEEALEAAQVNLTTIQPTCLAELQALMEVAEAHFAAMGPTFDEPALLELYTISVRAIGAGDICGVPGVDVALTSLCDLLDNLRTGGRYDREAVAVHIQAWRLLMNAELPAVGAEMVLAGLRKVSDRYAA